MFKVLTLNKISKAGLQHLPASNYEILDKCDSPDGILLRSFAMHDMELPTSLLAVGRAGAGVNNIPLDKCSEKGIVVFNTPGANANAVKELVICGLLMSSRKIYEGITWCQGLTQDGTVAKAVEAGKGEFVGPEIMGKKLGVIGLGAIGILTAHAAHALGMEIIGYDPFLDKRSDSTLKQVDSLDALYSECDYLSLNVPSNAETKGMINTASIAKMKDGVRIINAARAELVNNSDIKAAIESGKVSCYVTDFPVDEVLGTKGIITIPHLGASSPESEENCAHMAAVQLKEYLETGSIVNSVNFPNTQLGAISGKRVCALHKKDAADKLDATAGAKSIASNVRGEYGYTVFDVADDSIADALKKVDGVLTVRVI
ncbi:MAG: 3-phosphoglycerate dehydrogenase family protein [Defluviitaleaceae bacterium]|nr:3-phosphoglycerate dehydrogenase family protein [Defluviitaleaceae bacterium]